MLWPVTAVGRAARVAAAALGLLPEGAHRLHVVLRKGLVDLLERQSSLVGQDSGAGTGVDCYGRALGVPFTQASKSLCTVSGANR